MTPASDLPAAGNALERLSKAMDTASGTAPLFRFGGRVAEVTASQIRITGLRSSAQLGSLIELDDGTLGEVIAVQAEAVTVKLFGSARKVGLGSGAWLRPDLDIHPSPSWRGRVINALGDPIDGEGPLATGDTRYPMERAPYPPLMLERVTKPIRTGIRAIDLFTPLCAGQRIGIFAGSGVGKTTLLSMLLAASDFDTVVLALVAERGREVREFIEGVVAPQKHRTVTVIATSSEEPMMRKLSAKTAMAVAEYFRDEGDRVLLVIDSLTRYAHASRELALSAGEPPVARGYTPSVFSEIPQLLERAGPGRIGTGSITGVFSVLVDGDDHNEPISDTIRSVLDGHIVLDRAIAYEGRLPAINVLSSVSRLANMAWTEDEARLVLKLRGLIAKYEDTRDLRAAGAYQPGMDAELDQAVHLVPLIYGVLTQMPNEPPSEDAFKDLLKALNPKANEAAT